MGKTPKTTECSKRTNCRKTITLFKGKEALIFITNAYQ